MNEYLNYIVDVKTQNFIEAENLTPTNINTFDELVDSYQSSVSGWKNYISQTLSNIDFVVNSYATYGFQGYLNPTTFQNNYLVQSGPISTSSGLIQFSSSISGDNLLAPFGYATFPMQISKAIFNFDQTQLELNGNVNIDADYYGNTSLGQVIITTQNCQVLSPMEILILQVFMGIMQTYQLLHLIITLILIFMALHYCLMD